MYCKVFATEQLRIAIEGIIDYSEYSSAIKNGIAFILDKTEIKIGENNDALDAGDGSKVY